MPSKQQVGTTARERELIQRALDLEESLEDWEETWGPLDDDQRERLNAAWSQYSDLPGPITWAWRVPGKGSPFARFVAFVSVPVRRGDPAHASWYVSGYIGRTSARGVGITHLAIEPEHEGHLVTAEVLRAIKPAEIVAKVRARFLAAAADAELRRGWDIAAPTAEELRQIDAAAEMAKDLRVGQRGFSDDYYRGLAMAYLQEGARGRGVIPRLAARYRIPTRKIKDHLNTAKKRGFLQGGGHSGTLSYEAGPRLHETKGDEK